MYREGDWSLHEDEEFDAAVPPLRIGWDRLRSALIHAALLVLVTLCWLCFAATIIAATVEQCADL